MLVTYEFESNLVLKEKKYYLHVANLPSLSSSVKYVQHLDFLVFFGEPILIQI